jgi:hypothetical protein
MSDAYVRLRTALDGLEPEGFDVLEDEQLDLLAEAIERAREEHDRALDEATEESLSHIPRMLRPAVRRIVGG